MPNFANYFGDMFGGMDFSSLYGNMATQQQQMPTQPTTYQGQIPSQQPQPSWNNFSNFGLGSLWGDSGQHPGLGSWFSPSYSRYEAPSSESMQQPQQMQQQQAEQMQQQMEQQRQQGIEQQRYQNQLMEQQIQQARQQTQQGGALSSGMDALTGWQQQPQQPQQYQYQPGPMDSSGGGPTYDEPRVPPSYAGMFDRYQQQLPQQMGRDRIMSMIQGLF